MNKKQVLNSEVSDQHSQHSEKSLDDDDEVEEINVPRIDRTLSYEPDFNRIIMSVAFTHYPVVRQVGQLLGMRVTDEPEDQDWDVCWTDYAVHPQTFIRMHFHQSINYIPGIYTIARKNQLGKHLNAMKIHFPDQYNFHPHTWMLPEDYHLLRKYLDHSTTRGETLIVKPQAECQGRGIYLVNKIDDIQIGKYCVVQKYISNPLLIEGYKFDLRIYFLIGSIDPLRIYMYDDGLARFATESYQAPNRDNFRSNYQHLTNYAINKLNPKFKAFLSGNDGQGGFKRSLKSVIKLMSQMGANTKQMLRKIHDIAIKTIITSYQQIRHNYLSAQPQQYHNHMAFHILGLDILIDGNLNPILLQVNHTPSFATQTPLDHRIKQALIKDTLILMDCNSLKLKQQLFHKSKTYSNNRIQQGKRQIYNQQVRQRQLELNLQSRIQHEKTKMGGYELIYPTLDEEINKKYAFMIEKAKTVLYSNIKLYKQKEGEKDKQKEKEREKEKQKEREKQKQKEKDLFSAKQKRKSEQSINRQVRNYSTYNEKFRPDTQMISFALNNFLESHRQPVPQHLANHPLFNVTTKHTRTFTIKTKFSIPEIHKPPILKLQQQLRQINAEKERIKEKERNSVSSRQCKQGSFLKPKMYDVPSINLPTEQAKIIRRKTKEGRYISHATKAQK